MLPPVADNLGLVPLPFAIVNSFVALAVVVNIINSFPFASAINPPFANFGVVSVGLVPNTPFCQEAF